MSDLKCCICCCQFSINNFPRMMPSCEHSSCTNCLKSTITKNKNMFVICGICKNRQQIPELDLQYFPKNIALIKLIKDQSDQTRQSRSRQKSKSKRSQFSSQKRKQKIVLQAESPKIAKKMRQQRQTQMCQTHGKQKQIICLTDFIKLCPMCAVFGQHKDHKLQTIFEIQKHIEQASLSFYQLKKKKIVSDGLIKNQSFKLKLVQKINQRKSELTKKIKQQFITVHEAVQHAEKKAYDDLAKKFKQIYDKINNLVKEQNQTQKQYNSWALNFQGQLKKSLLESMVQKIARFYFNGSLNNLSEGQAYVKSIQEYQNEKKLRLQSFPNTVIMQNSESLIKDIYNHVTIKIQENYYHSFAYVCQRSSNKVCSQSHLEIIGSQAQVNQNDYNKKPIKVQFSSSQSFLSPINKKIETTSSPKKKSIPKQRAKSKPKQSTAKKQDKGQKKDMETTTQKIVQIFCNQQNLQTLDLSSFYLNDAEVLQILDYVCQRKLIKCFKLSKNKLTNEGFHKCLDYLPSTTNWNLSYNNLSEEALNYLIRQRQKTPSLRVVNISNNKVNERKAKSYIEQLKKIGIIVTL